MGVPASRLLLGVVFVLLAVPPASAATVEVNVSNFSYSPQSVTIQAGDTVRWVNTDGVHNVEADDGSFRCAAGCDGQGGNGELAMAPWSAERVFPTPGTYRYFCGAHGGPNGVGMSGMVIVQGAPAERGSLSFTGSALAIAEGGGNVTLTVARTGGDDGPVSVEFTTVNGSAVAGADYAAHAGTLSWADNDDAPKTFTVAIANDQAVESIESFNVVLSGPGGGASLGSPTTATVTIMDNDSPASPGALFLSSPVYSVDEDGGTAAISINRSGGTAGTVGVSVVATSGSAQAGADFNSSIAPLSWGPGDGSPKTATVTVIDDSDAEGDETFQVALSAPTGGATVGSPATATVTIVDEDSGPQSPCVADSTTHCFFGDRFKVTVDWRTRDGQTGQGIVIPLSQRSGLFYFFNPDNAEMLVKMLDGCALAPPLGPRYWVFYAATTNVELTLRVTDTTTGTVKTYSNPLGQAALPVQDTAAFATCP